MSAVQRTFSRIHAFAPRRSVALLIGVVALTLPVFATAAAPQCSPDKIAGSCAEAPKRKLTSGNPTSNKLIVAEIKEKARQLILSRGSPDDPSVRKTLARLDSLTFREARADEESCSGKANLQTAPGIRAFGPSRGGHSHYAPSMMPDSLPGAPNLNLRKETEDQPNAFYDDGNHAVVACPMSLRLSAGAWASMFAHELGHVISPCALIKQDYSKSSELIDPANPKKVGQRLEKCLGRKSTDDLELAFAMVSDSGRKTMFFPKDVLLPQAARVLSKLEACGLVTASAEKPNLDITPVFSDVEACVIHKNEDKFARMLKLEKARAKGSEPFVRSFANPAKFPKQCFSATEEEFADAFGSEVFGEWLGTVRDPETRGAEALTQMRKLECFTLKEGDRPNSDLHYPNYPTRLLSIMNSSGFQKSMGCQVDEGSRCSLKRSSSGSSTTNAGGENQPALQELSGRD